MRTAQWAVQLPGKWNNDPKSDVSSRTQSKVLKPLELRISEAGLSQQDGSADTGIGC